MFQGLFHQVGVLRGDARGPPAAARTLTSPALFRLPFPALSCDRPAVSPEYTRKVETEMRASLRSPTLRWLLISARAFMENELSKCRFLAELRKVAFWSLGKTKPKRRAIWLTVITWRG